MATDTPDETAADPNVTVTDESQGPESAPAKKERQGRRRIRTILATIFIVVASILAPVAGITVFVRNQLLNTNRYISNITPITQDPAIVAAMSTQVTNLLFTRVDVEQKIKNVLPPRADVVAAPIANALRSQTYSLTEKVISSEQFNKIWLGMQRKVHATLVKVLIGSGNAAVTTTNGNVVLDLRALATQVIHELDQRGIHYFDKIPVDKLNPQLVLIHAKGLSGARTITRALNHLALILPILVLVLFLGAIGISPRRRRAVMWSGVGLAISMAVLGIILGLARSYLVSAAGHELSPAAAGNLFDTLLRYLKTGLRILFVVGVVAALIAWVTGPSRPAQAVRRGVVVAWQWIEHNAGVVEALLVGVGTLLLIVLTPGWVWSLVIVLLVAAVVLAIHLSSRRAGLTSTEPDAVTTGAV